MIFLRDVRLAGGADVYPFNVPALRGLSALSFGASVTFLVGENGTGKSTLMEALAVALRLPAVGARDAAWDDTLRAVAPLAQKARLVFSRRPLRGFFLRAEDFFGYTRRVREAQAELRSELARAEAENASRSAFARQQAREAYVGQLAALEDDHGRDPDARSHGEAFLNLFANRLVPGGIYLLDEPEAPLSVTRQLALIRLIMEREEDSQFLIATHSPVLCAYPGAEILSFDESPARPVRYDEIENIRLLRDFLAAPERVLNRLRDD